MTVELECPECGGEVTAEVTVDPNYGADIDGYRGVTRQHVQLTIQCEHDLSDEQIEVLEEEAVEASYDDDDDYDD